MKFKLVEDLLIEAVIPSYRDMFLNLLQYVTNNDALKELLNDDNFRKDIQLHHIDRDYEKSKKYGRTYYKAKNNAHTNIAILPKEAHQLITNNQCDLEEVSKKYRIFLLRDCVPDWFANQVEKEITGG